MCTHLQNLASDCMCVHTSTQCKTDDRNVGMCASICKLPTGGLKRSIVKVIVNILIQNMQNSYSLTSPAIDTAS